MPRDFVFIDTSTTTAKCARELIQLINLLRQTLDQGQKVKAIMDHNTDGVSYADLESLFGLPVGKGQPVYNVVAGSLGALKGTVQSSDALTLIDRVG